MNNKILIKHGNTVPTVQDLNRYELGFAENDNGLYTKNSKEEIIHLNSVAEEVDLKAFLLDTIYPIGTVYFTNDKMFNPNTIWGGTWENVSGCYLYIGESNEAGEIIIPEKEPITISPHKLTVDNLAAHSHNLNEINISNDSAGTPEGSIEGISVSGHEHEFTGYTSFDGEHVHTVNSVLINGASNGIGTGTTYRTKTSANVTTTSNGEHNHNIFGTTQFANVTISGNDFNFTGQQMEPHTHTITGTVDSSGSSSPINHEVELNLPRMITLAWRRTA